VFAEKQIRATRDGRVAFELRRPRNNGATHVVFSELAFMKKLSALVPLPYHHAVRHFGVLASASPLRAEVVPPPPLGLRLSCAALSTPAVDIVAPAARRAAWAILLHRVYAIDALACPACPEGRLKIIAVITDPRIDKRILDHERLDDEQPPPRARGGSPPIFFDSG